MRLPRAFALLLAGATVAAAGLAGCPVQQEVPGEQLGTFSFDTWLVQDGCAYVSEGADAGSETDLDPFVAILSYDPGKGRFYLVSGATQLEGTLEGDRFQVDGRAERTLPCGADAASCSCPGTVYEHIEGTLYGEEQVAAGGCSAVVPDGGTPAPRDGGFDVRLVCGFVTDTFSAQTDACSCPSCVVVHGLSGERQ